MDECFATIREQSKKLCSEFNTIEAKQKVWVDSVDLGLVHESTGKYVTKSTAGFFPDPTVPAYKMCSLFNALLSLYETKDFDKIKDIEIRFNEALWEGFVNPTDKSSRKKKTSFRNLRMDVKPADYNNALADVYDAAVELTQIAQQKKDRVGEQIFGCIINIAAIASDAKSEPFNFEVAYQLQALDFVEKAINLKFYLNPRKK